MSGGLRTSVKGHLIAQRVTLAADPVHENETINSNVTTPQDPPPFPIVDTSMDSTSHGLGMCDGNIPCFPILISAAKMASHGTRTRAESPPQNGLNSNGKVLSVSVASSPQTEGEIVQSFNLKGFHFNELKTATRNFHPESVVGEGGFGCVFKGWIDEYSFTAAEPGNGMAIAIKRFNQQRTLLSHEECLTEVNCLGQLGHPNLVKLIGYCLDDDRRLLVYEYMPKGSLENHLFKRSSYIPTLSWNLRMKIALGTAKGLAFLHSDDAKVTVYGDFQTFKILLDSDYNAKLDDYGLDTVGLKGVKGYRSHVLYEDELPWYEDRAPGYVDSVCAYVAPECRYQAEDYLTPRSDVYSFGVVLLEMLSGKRAFDKNRPSGEYDLVQFASSKVSSKRKFYRFIDTRLKGDYSKAGAVRAFNLAIRCVSTEPRLRPDMNEVVELLEKLESSSGISQNESSQNLNTNSSRHPRRRINRMHIATAASHPTPSVSHSHT